MSGSTPKHSAHLAGQLDDVRGFIRDYVIAGSAQADTLTLWVAHTHAFAAFETTPFLVLTSPTKRCGKSRTLDVLELLAANPWRVITPSEAVLYRKISQDPAPTLLLDEADAIFNSKSSDTEPLRALLNAGNRRGTFVPRCVGPQQVLTDFSTFCPKALAGIGELPDTITDRAVVVRLTRKRKDEQALRFRHREALEIAEPLYTALASWAVDAVDDLAALRPAMPRELNDRAEEAWEPLAAIADLAGGAWPNRVRAAAAALSAPDVRDEETLGILLLRDIAAVFEQGGGADKLFSKDLAARLNELEESPWGDLDERGKPLDERGLARRLRPFGIRPKTVRLDDGRRAKGYHLVDLSDAFARYLDDFGRDTVTNQHSSQKTADSDRDTEEARTTRKPASAHDCHGVTDKNAGEPCHAENGHLRESERERAELRDRVARARVADEEAEQAALDERLREEFEADPSEEEIERVADLYRETMEDGAA
jgi:Protein of unknown function (DUF3631)